MRCFAASYFHVDCDPIGTAVALYRPRRPHGAIAMVADALDQAIADEEERCWDVPDDEKPDSVDICSTPVGIFELRDLFSARELRYHRHALRAGEVIWL